MNMDKTCLSYWYPKIEGLVPTPRTKIIRTDVDLLLAFHGDAKDKAKEGFSAEAFNAFIQSIICATDAMGYPCFLRTGMGSGKHDWDRTCFLTRFEDVPNHVAALVEWSEMVDLRGLATDVWVVREMLRTKPVATLGGYSNMPLCREFRVFVEDEYVKCVHPYWPERAIHEGLMDGTTPGEFFEKLNSLSNEERFHIETLASIVGRAVEGAWSVDILDTKDGWFVTDMAEAHRSWHWEGCPNGNEGTAQ